VAKCIRGDFCRDLHSCQNQEKERISSSNTKETQKAFCLLLSFIMPPKKQEEKRKHSNNLDDEDDKDLCDNFSDQEMYRQAEKLMKHPKLLIGTRTDWAIVEQILALDRNWELIWRNFGPEIGYDGQNESANHLGRTRDGAKHIYGYWEQKQSANKLEDLRGSRSRLLDNKDEEVGLARFIVLKFGPGFRPSVPCLPELRATYRRLHSLGPPRHDLSPYAWRRFLNRRIAPAPPPKRRKDTTAPMPKPRKFLGTPPAQLSADAAVTNNADTDSTSSDGMNFRTPGWLYYQDPPLEMLAEAADAVSQDAHPPMYSVSRNSKRLSESTHTSSSTSGLLFSNKINKPKK
jgi:hypothetical protein